MTETATVFDVVGGEAFFVELVNEFYDRVSTDPVLTAIYPEDLTESRRTTAGFLAQYWGGPPHYSNERGHPRLRMRHAPFRITPRARDHWLQHMLEALHVSLASRTAPPEVAQLMSDYFDAGSTAMINTHSPTEGHR